MNRPTIAAALLVFAVLLSGCKKPTGHGGRVQQPPPADAATMTAVDLYDSKRYSDALAKAEADALVMKGHDKEVAQLTAGLSAYALNKSAQAKWHLESLTGSADPQIAGRAEAVLGQIAERAGNKQYAADLFKRASAHLDGDDAARAAVRAGNSLAKLNRPVEAATQYRNAAKDAESASIRQTATRLGQPGPFTIQLGAFAYRAGAEQLAARMRSAAISGGVGVPRVVPDNINGKPGYSVQVGLFASRSAAENGKGKLGKGQFLVVAAE